MTCLNSVAALRQNAATHSVGRIFSEGIIMSQPKRIYTNGGPVQVGGGVYIERQADRDLLRHCRDGKYVFILSSRQVGKSSLMNNVARQLKDNDDTESVIIDLARMGAHLTADQWYQGLLTRIEHKFQLGINVADWWQARQHLSDADRFTQFLQEELLTSVSNRIVIFIDEIDTTLSMNFSDDFFAAIRAMYHARGHTPEIHRLSFVLIGVATPTDLIDDPNRTPFNIGEDVKLTDFTFDEAWPLAEGFAMPEREARKVLGRALNWTGGHPFLTQQLCRAIAEQGETHWTEAQLNDLVAATFLGTHAEQNIHLKAVRDLLTKRAPKGYEEAMLKTYRDVWRKREVADEARSIPKSHLKLTGIVQPSSQGTLYLRNEIYRATFDDRWVKAHLPVNWTKRLQRIALAALAALLLLNVPLGGYAWIQRGQAIQRANELALALQEAEKQKQVADKNAARAEEQKQEAEKQKQVADKNAARAEEQKQEAEKQKQMADKNAARAEEQKQLAKVQADIARQQRQAAIVAREEAEHLTYVANMNLAVKEFDADNYPRGNNLLNSYLPGEGKKDYRELSWFLLWKNNHAEQQTLRHTAPVRTVAWSQDGKTLASGSADMIKLWDSATGQVRTLSGHGNEVSSVAWSSDGKTLASASTDGTIKLWDSVSRRELQTLRRHLRTILVVAWSSDGKTLASGSADNTIKLWDSVTGKELQTLHHGAAVRTVAWSGDGRTLASGGADTMIKLWDSTTGQELQTLRGHGGGVSCVTWSGDSKLLASGAMDGTLKLWDRVSGEELQQKLTGHGTAIYSVAWSGDGKTLASGSEDQIIKLWDVASGRELRTLPGHGAAINSVAWSHDGKLLASGSEDSTIKLWDVAYDNKRRTLHNHEEYVWSVAWSADGKLLASGGKDKMIRVWDVASERELYKLRGHDAAVSSVAWSGDGKLLASGSEDKTIKLWDVASGKELHRLPGHKDEIRAVTWSRDGKLLASGSLDKTIKLWDVASGQELRTLPGHEGAVFSVAWSPDGKTLASASGDRTIKLWDMAGGRESRTLGKHGAEVLSVAWSNDGKMLVSGSQDNTIKLWDVTKEQELRTLRGHQASVGPVVWSGDGRTLASGSWDQTIKLWDVASGQELRTLRGHSASVSSVTWNENSKTLASGSWDKTIILWFAATESEVREHTSNYQWPQPRAAATQDSSNRVVQR
jgi:WD40 repeat protein